MNHKPSPSLTRPSIRLAALLSIAALSACASFTDSQPKATLTRLPAANAPATPAATVPAEVFPAQGNWWTQYGDSQLDKLVEQALAHNPTLGMAQARLDKVQALTDTIESTKLPQVTGSLDATHQLYTKNGLIPAPLGGSIRDTGTLQASAGWELDLFGKNRQALESAIGQQRAAQADMAAAKLILSANVVRSYFQWLRLQEQLDLAQRTLAQREQLLHLVQDRVNAGLDTQIELLQAQGALPEARLQIAMLQEQIALQRNALQALTAQSTPPELQMPASARSSSALASLDNLRDLPLDLLGRRPDIVAARWRVQAAEHDVAQAKTLFYPNINLVAFAGFSSLGLDKLLDSNSAQWGVGPAIRLPLFEAGRLRANLQTKSADRDMAIESYNALVLEAVRDVRDQLVTIQALHQQKAEQTQAQTAAEAAYTIAVQRYEAGLGNYLQVLNAQTNVLAQRKLAIDLQARLQDSSIQLVRALGGGYQADDFKSSNP